MIKEMARELLCDLEKHHNLKFTEATERRVESKMLKLFKRTHQTKRLNSFNAMYAIVFKPGSIEAIKQIKGWKSNAEMARQLEVSNSLISLYRSQKAGVSAITIAKIANATGNVDQNWHIFYELKLVGFKQPNEPFFNAEKHNGNMPYCYGSRSAELRKNDFNVEILPRKSS